MADKLKITLVKTVEMPDNDAIRVMIWHVRHLVKVEEI